MHVGLNLLHLVPQETGGSELYARRLIPALLAARSDLRLTLFAAREAIASICQESWATDVAIERVPVNARSRSRRILAEQTLLPLAARAASVDLLHNLFSTAPVLAPVPQVTTILDVTYKRYPEAHAGILSAGMALLVPIAAHRSRRVIAISRSGADDIARFLAFAPERIDVIYLGPGMPSGVKPLAEPELRRRLGVGDAPLILSVSAKRPHKNLERLIDAVYRLEGSPPPLLIVPGYETPFENHLRARASRAGVDNRVRFTGWLDDEALEGLYRAARCLAFPSLAEGFGLPVLEAMCRGTPVACSGTSSLPEIAGDAARYFNPLDTDDIAAAIVELLHDERLRERLARAGLERAKRFNWAATAVSTLSSYERALA